MTFEFAAIFAVIAILLVLSAFFSGSETALTTASRARIHQLKKNGDRRAYAASRLIMQRDRMIVTLLLCNNMVNILGSALATSLLVGIFGEAGVAYATLIMTMLVLIFAEVIPKTYAIARPDQTSLRVARIVSYIVTLATPITLIIQSASRLAMSLFNVDLKGKEELLSAHEELRGAIDLHHHEGGVVKTARDMLGGILDLKELEISDIMIHRTNMLTVNADAPTEKIISEVLSSTYTRIPLWREQPENIIGVLHAKDLARALIETKGDMASIDMASLTTPPWFVPDTTTLQNQLNAFLKRKAHFAMVVDEYGEVMGLVTLEDILEEIVGEIVDEHDAMASGIRPQKDGAVIVDGSVPIRDLNRTMEWDLPDEEATTIAGLVIHEARMIPKQTQVFTFHGFRFQVLRRQRNRITLLKIKSLKTNPQQTSVDPAHQNM